MRKVILDGILGDKFGREWNLDVASPGEAIIAINSQRKNFKTWLIEADKEGLCFEVLFGDNEDEGVEDLIELVHPLPEGKTITFVPIVEGSDNKGRGMIKMAIGIAMIVISQGTASPQAFEVMMPGMAVPGGGTVGAGAVLVPGTGGAWAAGGWANIAVGQLGWGLTFSGAAMYLTPEIADPEGANEDTNFLFNGAVNTVKQGVPVPVVYGRMGTGSVTAAASLFTETATSFQSLKTKTKFTGIPGWRTPGSIAGSTITYSDKTPWSCFIAGTIVIMGDGILKNIEEIQLGEEVLSQKGINTVIGFNRPILGNRQLYSFNNDDNYFVTSEHPFMTKEGWKSINPIYTKLESINLYNELSENPILSIGDNILTSKDIIEITNIKSKKDDYNLPLYSLVLENEDDPSFFANNYLVHNTWPEDCP